MMLVYAAGIGIGSGLTFFASTILLLDYFGRGPNLELFSIVNLISTVGSVGPAFAGFVADRTGSFVPAFLILAVLVSLVLVGGRCWMKPPHSGARRMSARIRRFLAGRERRLDRLAQHARAGWRLAAESRRRPDRRRRRPGLRDVDGQVARLWRRHRSLGQLAGIRHHDGGASPRSPAA